MTQSSKNYLLLFVILLLAACSPQRLLRGTTVYLAGNAPVEYMSMQPGNMPPPDPMKYADYYLQTLQTHLQKKGIEAKILNMGEEYPDMNNKTFGVQMLMTMMREEPGIGSVMEDPETKMKVNISSGIVFQGVDKEKKNKTVNIDGMAELSVEEQVAFLAKNPDGDIRKLALDKVAASLSELVADNIIMMRKKNKQKK